MSRTLTRHIHDALDLAGLLRPSWTATSARIASSGVPTCQVAEAPLKEKLKSIEAELSGAREENAVLRHARDQARAEYAKSRDTDPNSQPFKRATKAVEELTESDNRLEELRSVQVGVLKMLGKGGNRAGGDRNGPRSSDYSGHDGWASIASGIDLEQGRSRVDVPLSDLLRGEPMAGVIVTPSGGLTSPQYLEPFTPLPRDVRHIWPYFPGEQVDPGIMSVANYKQTGSRTVTGEIERDPVATTSKAKLGLAVTLETPPLKQLAIVVNEIPAKLLEAVDTFGEWLQAELSYQLSLALDQHVIKQWIAATPPHGKEGSTMVEQSRNGKAAMLGNGAHPTLLALTPAEAAALDVQKTGTAGLESYLFSSRDSGSSSPIWGLNEVEIPTGLDKPTLLDPLTLGYLYLGGARFQVDPWSGLDTNLLRARLECEVLLHVRNAVGAYRISTT
jgi:hypothetical protein